MKSNHEIVLTSLLVGACIGCANAQVAGVAPADAPSVKFSTPRRVVGAQTSVHAAQDVNDFLEAAQTQVGRSSSYISSSRSSGSSTPPVVIQFGAKDAAAIGAMEEDLAVMTHIIDRAVDRVGEDGPDEKLGVKLYYTSGGKSVRALYLDGFGPLIMVKVNFPVHSPGVVETKTPEPAEDSEWTVAQRAVRGLDEEVRWTGSSSSGVPYDAARVDGLKKHLIQALKNASNMKGVKPDEHINVSVFGSPAAVAGEAPGKPSPTKSLPGRGGRDSNYRAVAELDFARTTLQGTVLTLRARKSDVDAAAKGTLDDDAFAKKVTVNTYAGNGHGVTSVNTWIRRSSSSGLSTR
jgi:hypothetical protein